MVGRHPRRDGPLLLLCVAVMGMARPHLAAPPVVVGLLSGHDPKQWHNATCGAEGSLQVDDRVDTAGQVFALAFGKRDVIDTGGATLFILIALWW